MRLKTCCFTGHRSLPPDKMGKIIKRLNDEMENLMRRGVTDFISGGEWGFDLIAASLVVAKRELGCNIRLIFALPCRDRERFWPEEQARLFGKLLEEADEVRYISEEYGDGCVKKRNCHMVGESAFCICYLLQNKGGPYQMVHDARKSGISVFNVASETFGKAIAIKTKKGV